MSERRGIFEGVGVALVTPFRRGAVDTAALGGLAEALIGREVRALYPCGCTGEATSLTRVFHSGFHSATSFCSIHVAKASLSQMSSHHGMVTRSPNH